VRDTRSFGNEHAGIIRLVDVRHTEQGPLSVELLRAYGAELAQRAIVTAEPGRVRVRSTRS